VKIDDTLAAVDVHYTSDGGARAAVVTFPSWEAAAPIEERVITINGVAPYEAGAFYKRELPCILAALALLSKAPRIVLVDAHVWLGPDQPGLGARLLEKHPRGVETVVVVAKTLFAGATAARPVLRGRSQSPLFVDEGGVPVDAAMRVASMHGDFRVPTLLRRVDRLSREGAG
jgi:deoxyribonuclease V